MVRNKYPWERSTAKFAEDYLGIKLKMYQKIMLNSMDFRNYYERRFRSQKHIQRKDFDENKGFDQQKGYIKEFQYGKRYYLQQMW